MKPTLYILSGGAGASAEQVVHTILAQFPDNVLRVVTVPNVRYVEQIEDTIQRAGKSQGTIVHTLVDPVLRKHLIEKSRHEVVPAFDLMGPLLNHLSKVLDHQPLGEPGLYRHLNQSYYDRIAAIDFAMAHDDGRNPEGWKQADVVLVGVSRSGKTPLSLYLSVLGWKAANVPVVPGIDIPKELFKLPRGKVIGVTIETGQLLLLRRQRHRQLGAPGLSDYTNPQKVLEEITSAREIMRRAGFRLVDVTDKPIESSADEVIRMISGRYIITERED